MTVEKVIIEVILIKVSFIINLLDLTCEIHFHNFAIRHTLIDDKELERHSIQLLLIQVFFILLVIASVQAVDDKFNPNPNFLKLVRAF